MNDDLRFWKTLALSSIAVLVIAQESWNTFYNDAGKEAGGLLVGGDGRGQAGAGLMFDQLNQDQTVSLQYQESGGKRWAGLRVSDRPDTPLEDVIAKFGDVQAMSNSPAKQKLLEEMHQAAARGEFGAPRVFLGKSENHEAQLTLADAKGKIRLRLLVTADGQAQIAFLNHSCPRQLSSCSTLRPREDIW
ncbi:MAG: hypothetical protein M3Y57_14380 [Acidobacteriota bacterium]|nr:hypothetical protein [Acidobacteriota bacterium]